MGAVERVMPVPPDELFDVISDPTTYPRWLVGARRIRRVDGDMTHRDSSFEHEVGVGPIHIEDSSSVEHVVPDRELTLEVRARPLLVARVQFLLTEGRPGSTVLRLTETPEGRYRLLTPVIGPLIRWRNSRSLARLDRFLTRGPSRSAGGARR